MSAKFFFVEPSNKKEKKKLKLCSAPFSFCVGSM